MTETAAPAKRGRPRDATVDERVLKAAISQFADVGWSGFSIESVAKLAGVGKGSIYLRWSSAQTLLRDALETNVRFFDDPDTGNLRDDLLSYAEQLLRAYEGDNGRAYLRINLEGGPSRVSRSTGPSSRNRCAWRVACCVGPPNAGSCRPTSV